jgi:23S rRNA pseudouridine2605 synthase
MKRKNNEEKRDFKGRNNKKQWVPKTQKEQRQSTQRVKKAIDDLDYEAPKDTIRLNKYVANAGIASRRKADELIVQGLVKVNGEVVKEMGFRVKKTDEVQFKNKVIKPVTKMVYFLLNKPKNVITTMKDERGRKTVMDIMSNACEERIFPVGRLDRDTTGLLLFTNDGELAKKLSHPSYEVRKIYHVTLDKPIPEEDLEKIRQTLTLEDGEAPVDKVIYDEADKTKKRVVITIHIGRNRIVRRIFSHLGYHVDKLDRIYYGGLTKKNLSRGFHRPLTKQEVIMLKHFI